MNFNYLKEKVFKTLDFCCEADIVFIEKEGLFVEYKDGKATIGGDTPAGVCRAITEFVLNLKQGKKEFTIEKKPRFTWCGPMIDMSRDGVMKVSVVKEYLDMLACMGMNMLMLYTEDVYELEKYPFFGYKRGRYSLDDLREIDEYADKLGIEVIPCVQTLGHLERYLRWSESGPVKDTAFNLMPGTDESLEFIEEIIKTMKKTFKSKNIHIGMDEAYDVGTGAYFRAHRGEVIDQDEILFVHLGKVCKICEKYDYNPIIWSDLFFPDYTQPQIYTYNSFVPEGYMERIPDNVRLMYWYYSSKVKNRYETLIKRHKETGNPIAFAGGGWNWGSFAPENKIVFEFMVPALEACVEENPEMVMNTLWEGSECSYFMCFASNALFAEYQWSDKVDFDHMWQVAELVTGIKKEAYELVDVLNFGLWDNQNIARKLLRQDVLGTVGVTDGFNPENLPDVFYNGEPMKSYRDAADKLSKYIEENGDKRGHLSMYVAILRTAAYKAEAHSYLREAYTKNNSAELLRFKDLVLPEMKASYQKMYELYGKWWKYEYSRFGWEVQCARLGYQLTRIDYAQECLEDYLAGRIDKIEEFEEKPLHQGIQEFDYTMND